jgi:predicted permease
MIILNSLFPIFILLFFGRLLKAYGLTDPQFLRSADRLIYYFFFPLMLFWKIGSTSFAGGINWAFLLACIVTLLAMFALSTAAIFLFSLHPFQAGSFSQSCYRFNTYIGMAVILNSLGSEGVKYFGLVIGFAIPLINVFAVSVLIWFSGEEMDAGKRFRLTSRALISNPLILGCLAGICYAKFIGWFPVFINNALSLTSMVALPLALISIGGSLTFRGVKDNLGVALLAALMKLVMLPVIGFGFLTLFGVGGMPLKVGLLFFGQPASTAIYVLSSQLNSDTELASAAIVLSTVLSFFSLSVILLF